MRKANLIDQLHGVQLFSACSKGDLRIVARHAVEVDVPDTTVIVTEGEQGDTFYVVLEGQASVRKKAGQRARKVATLEPGGYFGELALLDPSPRNATVVATSDMRLAALNARVFRALLRDVPAMSDRLLTALARRLREADQKSVG